MLLNVQNLKTYFKTGEGTARAVDGVSFQIDPGETFALVGESGCGKSVTALSVIQLVPKPAGYHPGGSIRFRDRDMLKLPEKEKRTLRGNEISMIFQEPMTSLNPVLTVGYQLKEPLRRHQDMTGEEAREKAIEMLDLVDMPDPEKRMEEYPHQLSGGMKQRVMIAMAMACEPSLLIADEPTTALDVTIQSNILDMMNNLQKEKETAILFITHDMGVVAEMADRVGVMYAGRIVETGPIDQILENPAHPYTINLLKAIPSKVERENALHTIKGRVPSASEYPDHCRFSDRCHMVHDPCREIDPELLEVEQNHTAACILYDKELQGKTYTPEDARITTEPSPRSDEEITSEPLLTLNNLKVHFPIKKGVFKRTVGYVKAVDGVDLEIDRGTTLALVGESGCGKTTLGKGILQITPASAKMEGKIIYDGEDLMGLSQRELHPYRNDLQVVFQDPESSLNPRMMVGEILMEGMIAHGIGKNRADREKRVTGLLEEVGLDPDMIHRYPHEFSGGQRQRIGIARCLAVDPDFIVCDEPTSALDVSVQAQILNLLNRLQGEFGLTYLFITHDLGVVEYIADEVAVMYLGRIVEHGTTEEVFETPGHPYTEALLSAVPEVDPETGKKKIKLPGKVPSPVNPPSGCHFHPRCPEAMEHCQTKYPGAYDLSETHISRCFLHDTGIVNQEKSDQE